MQKKLIFKAAMTKEKKLPFFIFLGSSLEYFDFLLFPLLSSVLIQVFFKDYPHVAALQFIFFSLGSLGKILGGTFLGFLADLLGRKKIIQVVPLLMIIATLGIGVLPLGFSALFYVVLLCLFRLLQAVSFGAEITTASIYAYETTLNQKTKNISIVFAGATIGAILATAFLGVLNSSISQAALESYGFRIPFLFGTLLGAVIFLFRKNLKETYQGKPVSLKTLGHEMKANRKKIILSIMTMLFPSALIGINLFFPAYFNQYYQIPMSQIYFAQSISLCFSLLFVYLAGFIVDRYKLKISKIYAFITALFIAQSPFFLHMAERSIIIMMIFWQFFIGFTIVYSVKLMIANLSENTRGSFSAFIYNICFFATSFIPQFVLKYQLLEKDTKILFYIPAFLAAMSLASCLLSEEASANTKD